MMNTDLVLQDTCSHDLKRIFYARVGGGGDDIIGCTICKKKVVIPAATKRTHPREDIRQIIHITFGSAWAGKLFPE